MSTIKIKGIFFSEVAELFEELIQSTAKESGLTPNEFQKRLNKKYKKVADNFDETLISFYLKHEKFSLNEFLNNHAKDQKTIVSNNSISFNYFIIYIQTSRILYEKCYKAIKRKRISKTLQISIALYGIIIRRAEQIMSSLIDGYVDGAMIVWRSMYENIIAALTIIEEDNDKLVDKFYNHSFRNSKKKIISYNSNYKALKFKALSKKTNEILEKEEKRIKELYGKEFIENEYGWADELFNGKQKASLRLLEERLNLSRYRPYYLLCSEHTHLGFNTLKNYMEGNKIFLPRILNQNIGLNRFIDPMQFTIGVLHEINDSILYNISIPHEYHINIKFLEKIFTTLLGSFSIAKNSTKKE